jgi:hypothetical protein
MGFAGEAAWLSNGTGFPHAMPETAMLCGLPGALSVMLIVPLPGPAVDGVKVTVIVQCDVGAIVLRTGVGFGCCARSGDTS